MLAHREPAHAIDRSHAQLGIGRRSREAQERIDSRPPKDFAGERLRKREGEPVSDGGVTLAELEGELERCVDERPTRPRLGSHRNESTLERGNGSGEVFLVGQPNGAEHLVRGCPCVARDEALRPVVIDHGRCHRNQQRLMVRAWFPFEGRPRRKAVVWISLKSDNDLCVCGQLGRGVGGRLDLTVVDNLSVKLFLLDESRVEGTDDVAR